MVPALQRTGRAQSELHCANSPIFAANENIAESKLQRGRANPQRGRANPMSRQARLERWAELLIGVGQGSLATLCGTEHRTGRAQSEMRRANSPIFVAFADPVLREEGLVDDSYGAARQFFSLSDKELHEVVCSCGFGPTMPGYLAAAELLSIAGSERAASVFAEGVLRSLVSGHGYGNHNRRPGWSWSTKLSGWLSVQARRSLELFWNLLHSRRRMARRSSTLEPVHGGGLVRTGE